MPGLSDHLGWSEVLRGSGWSTLAEVSLHVLQRAQWAAQHVFEPLRERWGGPLRVISAVRSPEVNQRCGGTPKSRHLFGDAFDLRPTDEQIADRPAAVLDLHELIDALQREGTLPRGGLGLYIHPPTHPARPNGLRFVHVDGRGALARWNAEQLARARAVYGGMVA